MDNTTQERTNNFEYDAIILIQTYLRHLSFNNDIIPPVPLDGIWERETQESIIAFQNAYGLSPTGIVDRETWNRLKAEYDRSVALNSPPVAVSLFPRLPRDYSLKEGDKSYLSSVVQHMLDELERAYAFPSLSDSGVYDSITAQNIKEFQSRNQIPVSGDVDRETWDALAVQYNLLNNYTE